MVLVGGRSSRLGRDKALEPFDIGSLIERVLSRLNLFNSDIILVANAEQPLSKFALSPRVSYFVDIYPERGPLGGIYTGLTATTTLYNVVVACDMPFLNVDLINYMLRVARGFDVVVPSLGRMTEPLHAVYSKKCVTTIENLIKRNQLQVYKLFSSVKVRYLEAAEIDRFDPKHLSFFNINTEDDLRKAKELLKVGLATSNL